MTPRKPKMTDADFEPDVLARVREFAREHGRNWRFKLSMAWACGGDVLQHDGHLLRRARNLYGSTIIAHVGATRDA